MAEWLRTGLQSRVYRFDSGPGLHFHSPDNDGKDGVVPLMRPGGGVATHRPAKPCTSETPPGSAGFDLSKLKKRTEDDG